MPVESELDGEYGTCPKCGRATLRLDRPALNALSRTDNETYVCSDCGTREALEDFSSKVHPQSRWAAPTSAVMRLPSE